MRRKLLCEGIKLGIVSLGLLCFLQVAALFTGDSTVLQAVLVLPAGAFFLWKLHLVEARLERAAHFTLPRAAERAPRRRACPAAAPAAKLHKSPQVA